jgi:predicted dehydrogenase
MGLAGPGFIATHHVDAVRRLGDVEVIAIAGSSQASAERRAQELRIDRAYAQYQDLIDDDDVDVVHNTTPNYLHFDVTMAALRAGKHVVSDKPLAMNRDEARKLRDAALAARVAHVVTFNYRGNSLIQQARSMIADRQIGPLTFIHGHYLQDWMTDENTYSWRSDPKQGGASSALGDIGSHWCDLAEHVSGSRIAAVLADLTTLVPLRYAGASGEPVEVTSEDLASVLLRFENGAKGCFTVGQALPGHKNDLQLEVNGRSASLRWHQERQNELWVGRAAQNNSALSTDPALLSESARHYAHLPAGHQEGWSDAFRNVIADAYRWIKNGGEPDAKPASTASFDDGYRCHCVIEAILDSHAAGGAWRRVQS